jgi:hypothetical protein
MKLDTIQKFADYVRYTVTCNQGFGFQATVHLDLDKAGNILESSAVRGNLAKRIKQFVLSA